MASDRDGRTEAATRQDAEIIHDVQLLTRYAIEIGELPAEVKPEIVFGYGSEGAVPSPPPPQDDGDASGDGGNGGDGGGDAGGGAGAGDDDTHAGQPEQPAVAAAASRSEDGPPEEPGARGPGDRRARHDARMTTLLRYLVLLEKQFPDVTARTLAATEAEPGTGLLGSRVGRYLAWLWLWILMVVLLILGSNIIQFEYAAMKPDIGDDWTPADRRWGLLYQVSEYFEPFLYGALGSFLFLLRVSEEKLKERSFDTARKPEHVNRVILGTISGGTIILLIAQVPESDGTFIEVSAAALGLLAGYSIDFMFQTLDRVISAILPKVGLDTVTRKVRQRRNRELIRRYQAMLEKTDDPHQKELLQDVIDRLSLQ